MKQTYRCPMCGKKFERNPKKRLCAKCQDRYDYEMAKLDKKHKEKAG